MKKIILSLGILPFILASCGGSASFYGKTFTLKGTNDTLDEIADQVEHRTNRQNLTDNFSSINWSDSRGTAVSDHSSVAAVINELQTKALAAFSTNYGTGFSIAINSESSGFATVTSGGSQTGYKTQLSASGSYMNLNTAGGTTEYVLYHIHSKNGNFTKVRLRDHYNDVKVTYTLYYYQPISDLAGVQIEYWGNFLPN